MTGECAIMDVSATVLATKNCGGGTSQWYQRNANPQASGATYAWRC
jgi:hypothetical protein